MKRINSIDFTRGIVMIIMALDHVRDLLHRAALTESPTNLATTTPLLFSTRWITYLCAPTFVFLAGVSAYLSVNRKGSTERWFLLRRGLWLVALEFTVVNFGMYFNPAFNVLLFEVIATIGVGFIVLSLIGSWKPSAIGIIGLAILLLHNAYPLLPAFPYKPDLLFLPGVKPIGTRVFFMAYPPIPWLGIMLVGFAAGRFFQYPAERRIRVFGWLGVGCLLAFVALRFINLYGDPAPWSVQRSDVYTFLSFMNVSKYPPSLQFSLVTLGVMFLILVVGERMNNWFSRVADVYGKVPLFYFIVHFYLIHLILLVVLFAQGFHGHDLDFSGMAFGRPANVPSGLPLWAVYLVWIGVVVSLYWPCRWYARIKQTYKYGWLRYV